MGRAGLLLTIPPAQVIASWNILSQQTHLMVPLNTSSNYAFWTYEYFQVWWCLLSLWILQHCILDSKSIWVMVPSTDSDCACAFKCLWIFQWSVPSERTKTASNCTFKSTNVPVKCGASNTCTIAFEPRAGQCSAFWASSQTVYCVSLQIVTPINSGFWSYSQQLRLQVCCHVTIRWAHSNT